MTTALGFVIPISTSATDVLFVVLLGCWLLSGDYAIRLRTIRRSRVAVLAIVMFALYTIACTYSSATLSESMRDLLTYRKYLYVPALITVFAHSETRKNSIRAFLLAMLVTLGASFLMSWGLLHSYKGTSTDCVFFKNHITQGMLMSLFVAVLVSRGWPKSRLRWLYAGVILLAVYNIFFMVAGRTGYMVFFALVLLWLYRAKGRRGLLLAVALLGCLTPALYICSSGFRDRLNITVKETVDYCHGRTGPEITSVGQRLLFYQTALDVVSRSPLVGTGTGSFETEFEKTPENQGLKPTADPHNEYLSILVQAGLIGLCVFLWWIYSQWSCSNRLPPELASVAQATIVMALVAGLFNSIFFSATEGCIYCYFIALCCGSLCEAAPNSQPFTSESRPARRLTSVPVCS